MPFANFKVPAGSLTAGQKEAVVHGATDLDRKSTRLNSSHPVSSRMPSSA